MFSSRIAGTFLNSAFLMKRHADFLGFLLLFTALIRPIVPTVRINRKFTLDRRQVRLLKEAVLAAVYAVLGFDAVRGLSLYFLTSVV